MNYDDDIREALDYVNLQTDAAVRKNRRSVKVANTILVAIVTLPLIIILVFVYAIADGERVITYPRTDIL